MRRDGRNASGTAARAARGRPGATAEANTRFVLGVLLAVTLGFGGCQSAVPAGFKPTWARFFLEAPGARGIMVRLPQSEVGIVVNAQPVLTEADIVDVDVAQVDLGRCLAFRLSAGAARDCYRLTASHQGRRLVLFIDNSPVGARRIDAPIGDGVVFVFVELPDSALPQLVSDLKLSASRLQRELARR